MGEALRKAKREEVAKRERIRKLKYIGSIPLRLIKAVTGFIFCIVVVPGHAAIHCFQSNTWIWKHYNA